MTSEKRREMNLDMKTVQKKINTPGSPSISKSPSNYIEIEQRDPRLQYQNVTKTDLPTTRYQRNHINLRSMIQLSTDRKEEDKLLVRGDSSHTLLLEASNQKKRDQSSEEGSRDSQTVRNLKALGVNRDLEHIVEMTPNGTKNKLFLPSLEKENTMHNLN